MDREKVISHLNDCMEASRRDNTWVFVRKDIVKDVIVLLKEQENETTDRVITDDASIPEQFWPSMRYDPSEDVVACTSCLICGKDIPLRRYESGPRVCSECKEAVTAIKIGDRNAAD